ncbi:MAG: tRNA (adenosine(37)-N6)-threonylcarbamoyltransferase complex ATPase subunit type 1 TsaE [Ruminococcus sp.]|nr:tRNA (adenosine(37)-N6)-threonylcarbamoyltransferase complex ATPase subunit type 1 TsaE [Ruminococcus sp.]
MTYCYTTSSPAETIALGRRIGALLRGGDCLAYVGGLGAGKTTMTRGIALGMGLEDDVTSPTFALVNEYRGTGLTLIHFDMYRITSPADLETTGFFDYMDEDTVLAVEWSENISDAIPPGTVYIRIERTGDDTRKITIDGDERFADIGDRDLG